MKSILPRQTKLAGAEKIITEVCKAWQITRKQIIGDGRTADLSFARHLAICLCRQHTQMSLTEIAALFRRDHTLFYHAQYRVDKAMAESKEAKEIIKGIINKLNK